MYFYIQKIESASPCTRSRDVGPIMMFLASVLLSVGAKGTKGLESLCQVSHVCISDFAGILIGCFHKGCCCYCIWIWPTFESSSSFLFNLQWWISCRAMWLSSPKNHWGKLSPAEGLEGIFSFQSCLLEGSGAPSVLRLAAFPSCVKGKPLPLPLPFCLAGWWLYDFSSVQNV